MRDTSTNRQIDGNYITCIYIQLMDRPIEMKFSTCTCDISN